MRLENLNIKEYLTNKGIEFVERNGELITRCLFNSCDEASRTNEAHLYFNIETSQYQCKKCSTTGNLVTLTKHLGDYFKEVSSNQFGLQEKSNNKEKPKFDPSLVDQCHQNLPLNIRDYLNNRGITDDSINHLKIGYGEFYGKSWITIPICNKDGDYIYLKLRKDPSSDDDQSSKYLFYPSGSNAEIYGWDNIKNGGEMVMICEGEFDRLVLEANGIPAITSTAGAGAFKKEWIKNLLGFEKIYVCFDKDETGERESDKLIQELLKELPDATIYKTTLPERMTDGKDITDYFVGYNGNPDELIYELSKKVNIPDQHERVVQVPESRTYIEFNEWKNTIRGNFPDLVFAAEIVLSVISQILIKDITNPFALVLVDVPSSGKTITINFFSGIKELTYESDNFTTASFVSSAANIRKEKLSEIDMLPRIRYKTLLVRELAVLFSKREEDLLNCLGTLTRVLDGEGLNTDTGVHGQRGYTGEYLFMLIAATTPIQPRVWKAMGNLGSRLFFINLHSKIKDEEELASQLVSTSYKDKEITCQKATKNFLYTLWSKHPKGVEWDRSGDDMKYVKMISRVALLLSRLRGVINVWEDRYHDGEKYDYTEPNIEQPNRINQLLYNLCRGHAVALGRNQIDEEDLRIAIELALDSAPLRRSKLFRKILDLNGQIKTSEVEVVLGCSNPSALKEMEALRILDLCNIVQDNSGNVGGQENILKLKDKFAWFISDECREIRGLPVEPYQSTLTDFLN